jgi:hypothetical protein
VSNLYEYCVNDPQNLLDLDGMQVMAGAESKWYAINEGNVPNPYNETKIATMIFLTNYHNMIKSQRDYGKAIKGVDKYFHCMANCQSAKLGYGGFKASHLISEIREITDVIRKGDTKQQCDEDRAANNWGRTCPPDESCKDRCSKHRPSVLSDKY